MEPVTLLFFFLVLPPRRALTATAGQGAFTPSPSLAAAALVVVVVAVVVAVVAAVVSCRLGRQCERLLPRGQPARRGRLHQLPSGRRDGRLHGLRRRRLRCTPGGHRRRQLRQRGGCRRRICSLRDGCTSASPCTGRPAHKAECRFSLPTGVTGCRHHRQAQVVPTRGRTPAVDSRERPARAPPLRPAS